MNPATKKRIQEYRYEDAKELLNVLVAGNLILALLMLFPDFEVLSSGRSQILLLTILIYIIAIRGYDWKSRSVNILSIVFYITLCIYELYAFGSPAYLIDYDAYTISKGIMLDLLIWSLPSIYVLLRFALVIPLIKMAIVSK